MDVSTFLLTVPVYLHTDTALSISSERSYDNKEFNNCVVQFPFDDHQVPPLSMIDTVCESIDSWLEEDEGNVVAVHCKAGN